MYAKVKRGNLPKRERKSTSLFEATPEWKALKSDLDRGLKSREQCRLQFSQEDWDRIGLSGEPERGRNTAVGCKSVRRFILKYLESIGREYNIKTVHSGGFDYVIIEGPE